MRHYSVFKDQLVLPNFYYNQPEVPVKSSPKSSSEGPDLTENFQRATDGL